MSQAAPPQTAIDQLREALAGGRMLPVQRALAALNPAEIANILTTLPPQQRYLVWELVSPEDDGEVLLHVPEDVRTGLIRRMDTAELIKAAEELEIDDLADLIEDLPETVTRQVLRALDADDRARLESVLGYASDTAGGLMNTDTVTVRPDVTLDVVQRYLRLRGELPEHTDALYVVDRYGAYLGSLPLEVILTRSPDERVASVMQRERPAIHAEEAEGDVARRFEHADLVSAPVIDAKGVLVGRITIDDVVDVIRAQADHDMLSMAGLDEDEDLFAPIHGAARRRAVWLGINLLTAFAAAWVVSRFEGTITQIAALAVMMPVIASMGGIGGSQTLTLMIRGLAMGQIDAANTRMLLRKELAVAAINGVLWAAVIATVVGLWFGNPWLALVSALAIIINQIIAAASGVLIPLLLKKLAVDPALAGSVVLTTVTDVIGFFALLGLGTLILR